MKKLLTAFAALAMAVALSVGSLAATTPATVSPLDGEGAASPATGKGEGSYSLDIVGNFVPATPAATVISVDIAWETMVFTYTEGAKGDWNPADHKYQNSGTGSWSTNKPAITVTNHSNADVIAKFDFTLATSLWGYDTEGAFYSYNSENGKYTELWKSHDKRLTLDSAEGKTVQNAPKGTIYFGVSGDAPVGNQTLGTIEVTVRNALQVVGTLAELKNAIAEGGKIQLSADITGVTDCLSLFYDTELDLNGHTISGSYSGALIQISDMVVIRNGSISNSAGMGLGINNFSVLELQDCTVTAARPLSNKKIATVTDCTLNSIGSNDIYSHAIEIDNRSTLLALNGNTTLTMEYDGDMVERYYTIFEDGTKKSGALVCQAGFYNENPMELTDSYTTDVKITKDETNSTYTVEYQGNSVTYVVIAPSGTQTLWEVRAQP